MALIICHCNVPVTQMFEHCVRSTKVWLIHTCNRSMTRESLWFQGMNTSCKCLVVCFLTLFSTLLFMSRLFFSWVIRSLESLSFSNYCMRFQVSSLCLLYGMLRTTYAGPFIIIASRRFHNSSLENTLHGNNITLINLITLERKAKKGES